MGSLVALLLLPTAFADADTDTSPETETAETAETADTSGDKDEETGCKCASVLTNPTSMVSLTAGLVLLTLVRRRRTEG
jgi:hypothetical protein